MPTKQTSSAPVRPAETPSFNDLLQIQFHLVCRLSERQAEKENQELFGLRLSEARILGLVGSHVSLPIRFLTANAHFEKGHASRLVSALVRKGLVRNKLNPEDKRTNFLCLTPKGEALYARCLVHASNSNQSWLDVLPKKQHDALRQALSALIKKLRDTEPEAPGKKARQG